MLNRWLFRTFTKTSLEAATPPVPFLVVTILAVGLALASASQVTCPVCHGAGTLKTARGLEAEITKIFQTDHHVPAGCCDNPVAEYTYIATVAVTNPGATTISGNITINFYDPGDFPPGDTEQEVGFTILEVEVPAGVTKIYEQTCFLREYGPLLERLHRAAINSDILKTEVEIPCAECAGRGTTALFDWLEGKTK